jgi:hypothetical protein
VSMHRLIAMPAMLGMGFLVVASINDLPWHERVSMAALTVYFVLTLFWGTRLAAEAISDEVRGKTWDQQRMSAIGPWDMTWGKLFGATAFAWYGGALCLAVYLFAARDLPGIGAPTVALALIAAGVLLHAFAMAVTLQSAQKGWSTGSRWATLLPVLIFLAIGPALAGVATRNEPLFWFGVRFGAVDFLLASILIFSAWAVFGAYRVMCLELQVRTTPLAWCAYTLFLSIYLAGFLGGHPGTTVGAFDYLCVSGLAVSVTLTYAMLFSEQNSAMTLRRMLLRAGQGQWLRVFEEMPCWPSTVVLACIFAIGIMVSPDLYRDHFELLNKMALMPLVIVFLLVRDAAILLFFAFAKQARRVEATALLYMVLLYWLLPGLFQMAGLDTVAEIILPLLIRPGVGSLIACAQAGIAIVLCVARWRKNYAQTGVPAKPH